MKDERKRKTAFHILMHLGRLLQQEIASELSAIGLHHGQGRILAILKDHGTMTQATMARVTDLKPATVTNMLKPLEKRELISRAVDPKTNRAMVVTLTAKGAELADAVQAAWQAVEARLIATMPESERDGLFSRLEGFRDVLGGSAPAPREAGTSQ